MSRGISTTIVSTTQPQMQQMSAPPQVVFTGQMQGPCAYCRTLLMFPAHLKSVKCFNCHQVTAFASAFHPQPLAPPPPQFVQAPSQPQMYPPIPQYAAPSAGNQYPSQQDQHMSMQQQYSPQPQRSSLQFSQSPFDQDQPEYSLPPAAPAYNEVHNYQPLPGPN